MAEPGDTAKKQSQNPPNFVTLVQLKERWLKKKAEEEEERIRRQQQQEREEEERRRKLVEAKEENERRRKLTEAKELSGSEVVRQNFGTSSRSRQNRNRRTQGNVVATVGFAEVVDDGDKDDEDEERLWRAKEAKEHAKSEAVRNSGTSSQWRQNRFRGTPGNLATEARAQAVDDGNEDDEAIKLKEERYRRKKELKAAKRAREKQKVKEAGKQPVVSEAVSIRSESMEVMMDSQRKHDNVEKQTSKRGSENGNGKSVTPRKPQRRNKGKIGNLEKKGTKLEIDEKLGELTMEEESGSGFETRNGASYIVEKDISKTGAETGNGSVPCRKPQTKYKVNMEFRGKFGDVEKEGSKVKIEEELNELSIAEENGGFETKNVEKQISKGAEIGNESIPSRKPQRNSKVDKKFGRKLGNNAEKEGSELDFKGNLGELSIEEESGGFETKNGITDGDQNFPSRKPQRKSKVNVEFRRKVGKNVEQEESKLEIEGNLEELLIEEENGECETKNGVSEVKHGRGRGRLNRSERQNDECKERSYRRFNGSRGRGNVRGGRVYQNGRMRGYNGDCELGVWVRKGDVAGPGVESTVKSSNVLLQDTNI
ncbi:unnamed protein product [Linum tenue]|uniref:Uncharacterized protein n=1 Tax=Linum tenue TaxID=586396 RepID=A0AAV0P067_9ROSI|nr:unnamed protein product [Linum tenue]